MDDKLTHIILTDHALRYGLDGKSAYEIAQKYGYEGTEQEYAEGPVIAKDKANKAADSADKAAERAKKSASTPTSRLRVRNLWPTTLRRSWMSTIRITGPSGMKRRKTISPRPSARMAVRSSLRSTLIRRQCFWA